MRRGRGSTVAGFALLSLLAAPLPAQKKLGEWYVDSKYGFKFQPPDWKPIPPQIGAVYEIASFQGPELVLDAKKNWVMDARLWVVRIETRGPGGHGEADGEKASPSEPETPGDGKAGEGKGGGKPEKIEVHVRARTFEQWLRSAGPPGAVVQSKKEKKTKELTADEYLLSFKTSIDVPGAGYAYVAHLDGQDIALVYMIPEPQYDKWAATFRRSAGTFKSIEREASASASSEADPNSREAQIARVREEASRTAGWNVDATDHYIVLYSTDDKRFLDEVKGRIEAIREIFVEDFPQEREIGTLPILRITKSFGEYQAYGGGGGGQFNSATGELVVPCYKEVDKNWSYAVLNHEAFHQYIHFACGNISPHSWYNEGTGDYYAGMRLKGNTFVLGKCDINFVDRVKTVKEAIKKGEYAPLEKLVEMTQAEYYANGELHYAQGWSLIYFLREGKKQRAPGWDPAWENILPNYFDTLVERKKKGENDAKCQKAALEEAFRGVDFEALERSWKEFTLR